VGLELILSYFVDSWKDRQAEYDYCVHRNLEHPFVDRIHNLGTRDAHVAADIRGHAKWNDVFIDHRMTFKDAFDHANQHLAGRMVGICNLDIFLDTGSDWSAAEDLLRKAKVVLCQSRLEFTPPSTTYLDPTFDKVAHALTQDAWFFIPPLEPPAIDFEIGTLGCDNALAERICRVGYLPVNFASRFRVMHYDVCRGKIAENQGEVHRAESVRRSIVLSRHPEREGCFLVPDFDRMTSLDKLVAKLGLSRLLKYKLICEVMSRFIKVNN
jgi:hypothetical protein